MFTNTNINTKIGLWKGEEIENLSKESLLECISFIGKEYFKLQSKEEKFEHLKHTIQTKINDLSEARTLTGTGEELKVELIHMLKKFLEEIK